MRRLTFNIKVSIKHEINIIIKALINQPIQCTVFVRPIIFITYGENKMKVYLVTKL